MCVFGDGPDCAREFTVYKRAGSTTLRHNSVKNSVCSATYRPQAHRPIYRDLGALVHSKYLYDSVRHTALIVALDRARHPQGPRENNIAEHPMLPAHDYYKTGRNRDVRFDAPIPRRQLSGLPNGRRSVGRDRGFESFLDSLDQGAESFAGSHRDGRGGDVVHKKSCRPRRS